MTLSVELPSRAIGASLDRIDGPLKVTGAAKYAFEYPVDDVTYIYPIQSTIAKGRVVSLDTKAAQKLPGVVTILWHKNAPRLAPLENQNLAVFQSDAVAYHGQFIAAVVAETSETARYAASLVKVRYEEQPHDVELRADRHDLYKPAQLGNGSETDSSQGEIEAALEAAPIYLSHTYTTPPEHNNPMEPHTTLAVWSDDGVTLYDSNQGPDWIREDVARAFQLSPERVHIISPYVGGGFGSKGYARPQVILAALAAKAAKRPAKIALTRQQMFDVAGYRTPTIQRVRLGAERDGRLVAIAHDVIEQTGQIHEFVEQTAVATRMMYAAPNRSTTHRVARLDLPENSWMRAPGECPGMFALESAMDELAIACGIDPIELRIRNEPTTDPETGQPFSSRGLVACLREGAERFGWAQRNPQPGARRAGSWLVGMGVAASTYPVYRFPAAASVRLDREGQYTVRIAASDIGTGTWTALTQIAANALEVPVEQIKLEIGDSSLPQAGGAGGSSGTASWGSAIVAAAQKLRARQKRQRSKSAEGLEAVGEVEDNPESERFSMHAFGAQFAEVRVNRDTGEVRVPRLLGIFAAGHIINPKMARSQFLGGMTMGLSMALFEASVLDPRFGDFVNHDFAEYHIATNADVGTIDVHWIDEDDRHLNPMGAKGIGEIGIVGTAAAIANATHHATGIRVRDLPITPDKLLR